MYTYCFYPAFFYVEGWVFYVKMNGGERPKGQQKNPPNQINFLWIILHTSYGHKSKFLKPRPKHKKKLWLEQCLPNVLCMFSWNSPNSKKITGNGMGPVYKYWPCKFWHLYFCGITYMFRFGILEIHTLHFAIVI